MANPTDFLLNTDYEMDKIIYFYETSVEITNTTWQSEIIYHNLTFAPLCFGLWSRNKDFSDPHRMTGNGHGIYDLDSESYTATYASLSSSDYTNVSGTENPLFLTLNLYNMPTGTVYVRIYGFEPEYSHAHISSTSKHANTFILNTDYNYRKLLKKGYVEVPKNQQNLYDPVVIEHNLGYIPQIMLWIEDVALDENEQEQGRNIDYYGYGCLKDQLNQLGLAGLVIDDKKMTFYLPGGVQAPTNFYLHYRIYYDKAQ